MSIEIDWNTLTTGPDGLALAESIREFIHEKFQQVALPRFIRSVEVHSLELGDDCPTVILKDICDPLPEFYDKDEDNDDGDDDDEDDDDDDGVDSEDPRERDNIAIRVAGAQPHDSLKERRESKQKLSNDSCIQPFLFLDKHRPGLRPNVSLADQLSSSFLSRSGTPGIPGGTSNLSYFHLPLSGGLSGSQTPLAAVAGGRSVPAPWSESHYRFAQEHSRYNRHQSSHTPGEPSSGPSTARSHAHSMDFNPIPRGASGLETTGSPREPSPNDIQVVLHVSYTGNIRLSLTAEILLDYPMPSFVGIPLQLTVTGLSFDGVALLAYLNQEDQNRACFCFLGPEDADMLVGAVNTPETEEGDGTAKRRGLWPGTEMEGQKSVADKLGGLLKEIRVESEIGQRQEGRQSLKNVGKVEKFVLEQVRRIFEDEFVWPSFWTFLV